jgi:hypothetical protein
MLNTQGSVALAAPSTLFLNSLKVGGPKDKMGDDVAFLRPGNSGCLRLP